jgi:hypothetical protein
MARSKSSFTVSQTDYDGEGTSMSVLVTQLSGANIATELPKHAALQTAVDGISIGVINKTQTVYELLQISAPGVRAASPQAQREAKWLIRYYDTTTFREFSTEVGCADLTLLTDNNSTINLLDGATPPAAFATFKTAFEAVVSSPDGNSVKLIEAVHVGRNN